MRVLLFSVPFAPSVGGVETVSASLAEGLTSLGCEVVVVTQTAEDDHKRRPYRVLRRPGPVQLLRQVLWSDVVFHNNINLRNVWPLLLARKPWVVAHHMWLPRTGKNALESKLKRYALRWAARNIAVSSAMAADIGYQCKIIPNPYDSSRFRQLNGIKRDREIVYLGRLVSDKGVNLLLSALFILKQSGVAPRLTIVGTGPEESALKKQVADLKLQSQVTFTGAVMGDALVRQLNAHRLMVIPSLWREPFGVVALEGIACGCIPIAADGGGLQEATGTCGLLFARGDSSDLADKIQMALSDEAIRDRFDANAAVHLMNFQKSVIAEKYRRVLAEVVPDRSGQNPARRLASGTGRTPGAN